jgi:4,5:9,10-diseco-3-hydroxy-5,9,17-trioxoandrosta-1(10),2-diene-4-oate hydrolase
MAIDTELTFDSTTRTAQLDDLKVHYNEAGSGEEVLIALHGSGPGASGWSNFKGNLPTFASRFRTLLVDQPGFGGTDKPVIKEAILTYCARAVRDLMDSLGIEKAHFVGNSMGGSTTLRFALDYPERAGKLVMMAGGPTHSVFSPHPSEGMRVLQEFFAPPGPSKEKMERFVRVMVWDQRLVTEELLEERWRTVSDPETLAGFVRNANPDRETELQRREESELWRHLEKVNHQVLLIWGRDDRVVPLDGAFFGLRRLRNSRLHVFSRCGHWVQVERRDEFNRLVMDFLTH